MFLAECYTPAKADRHNVKRRFSSFVVKPSCIYFCAGTRFFSNTWNQHPVCCSTNFLQQRCGILQLVHPYYMSIFALYWYNKIPSRFRFSCHCSSLRKSRVSQTPLLCPDRGHALIYPGGGTAVYQGYAGVHQKSPCSDKILP